MTLEGNPDFSKQVGSNSVSAGGLKNRGEKLQTLQCLTDEVNS